MTSDPISRQALDEALEAYTLGESTPEHRAVIADAAQALLDGVLFDWCAEHDSSALAVDRCAVFAIWNGAGMTTPPCRFDTQLRIPITP